MSTQGTHTLTLSEQEQRVLQLTISGLGDKEVAREMNLALDTVRTYWNRIRTKIGGQTRPECIATYLRDHALGESQQREREFEEARAVAERSVSFERRRREFTESILTTMGGPVVVVDLRGRFVKFNGWCERVTGWTEQEVLGRYYWEIVLPPEDAQTVVTAFQELRLGRFPDTFTNHWITRQGERRLIEWTNTALTDEDGRLEFLVGTGVDITELRAEQAKFRAFMDSIPAVTFSKDRQGRLTYVNKKVEEAMQREAKDLLGKTNFEFVPEHIAIQAKAEEDKVWKARQPLNFYRVEPREEGDRHWMVTKFLYEEEPGREALGAAAIDVTAIKTAEERLRLATDSSFDAFVIMKSVRDKTGAIKDLEIEHINSPMAKYLRRTPEELIGTGLLNVSAVSTVKTVFEVSKSVIDSGETAHFALAAETAGNEGRWLSLRIQKVGDGIALTARDITEQREKEKELREQACQIEALRLRIQELEAERRAA